LVETSILSNSELARDSRVLERIDDGLSRCSARGITESGQPLDRSYRNRWHLPNIFFFDRVSAKNWRRTMFIRVTSIPVLFRIGSLRSMMALWNEDAKVDSSSPSGITSLFSSI
jgi:hypothetical protein